MVCVKVNVLCTREWKAAPEQRHRGESELSNAHRIREMNLIQGTGLSEFRLYIHIQVVKQAGTPSTPRPTSSDDQYEIKTRKSNPIRRMRSIVSLTQYLTHWVPVVGFVGSVGITSLVPAPVAGDLTLTAKSDMRHVGALPFRDTHTCCASMKTSDNPQNVCPAGHLCAVRWAVETIACATHGDER